MKYDTYLTIKLNRKMTKNYLEYFVELKKWNLIFSYIPYPGGGEKWGGNGVGDDLYSFGFDGTYLWTGNLFYFC